MKQRYRSITMPWRVVGLLLLTVILYVLGWVMSEPDGQLTIPTHLTLLSDSVRDERFTMIQSRSTYRGLEASIKRLRWKGELLEVDFSLRIIGSEIWSLRFIEHLSCLFWDVEGNRLESDDFFWLPISDDFLRAMYEGEKNRSNQAVTTIVEKDYLHVARGADSISLALGRSQLITKRIKLPDRSRSATAGLSISWEGGSDEDSSLCSGGLSGAGPVCLQRGLGEEGE